jgi:hypothetical protein
MRFHRQGSEKRAGYSALMPVIALLAAATFAKLSAAAQLFHIAH